MYCDSAEPDRIEQLKRAGFNAKPAKKGTGSVKAGIDWMKQHAIRVGGPAGEEARREFRNYRWQTRDGGQPTDEPVGTDDHAPDMTRYAAHAHYACASSLFQHLNGTIQTPYCSSPVTPVERRYCKVGSRMLQDKLVSRRSCMNTGEGDEIP
jgi:hypothetical protein